MTIVVAASNVEKACGHPPGADLDLDIVTRLSDNPDYSGCLPADFLHGYSTAAYQIEGATAEGGRGPSVWDPLFAGLPFSGDDACDSYHQWQEDVELLKKYGAKAYRFSISWSRIIPLGGRNDPVNMAGIKYYGNLIDGLLAANINPIVTLFHYDTPLAVEERYKGWTCSNPMDIVLDFTHYARVCFQYFGDRVKDWITINELPYIFSCMNALGLKQGFTPPDLFAIGHRVTLAHAYAALVYRTEFQPTQNGSIGIALDCEWNVPIDDSRAAREAADAAIAKSLHMFADPLFLGRENELAREHLAFGHPRFSDAELKIIRQSFGINAYGTAWATGNPWDMFGKTPEHEWSLYGGGIHRVFEDKQGRPIGKRGKNGHPYIVPWGFRQLLNHCWTNWAQGAEIPIRVFENGYPIDGEENLPLEKVVDDKERQQFFNEYIKALCDAVVVDGCHISTYMAWSLLDNLEWTAGYDSRFGVTHVDRENCFKRTPKNSAEMLRRLWEHVVRKAPEGGIVVH